MRKSKQSTTRPADHPSVPHGRVGVLLANLGTPDAAEPKAVKRYLKQFLSDRRVVEISPLLWQPILRGVVLRRRPKKSAHAYSQVWSEEGSPLAAITIRQVAALRQRLGGEVVVNYAMRYGHPAIDTKIAEMKAAGCDRILFAPLYPQYCAATTATANDAAFDAIKDMRWQPALRTMAPYFDAPEYIDALAMSVKQGIEQLAFRPDAVLASFHGMPQRTLDLGDPYHCHCRKTARLLGEKCELPVLTAFQSRFGRAKWLEPATDITLKRLADEGVKRIAVIAPGFSADCLETLEELDIRGRAQFMEAGGKDFAYLPCLNDSDIGIDMLEALVRRELAGWI